VLNAANRMRDNSCDCGFQFNCTEECPGEQHRIQENGIIVCVPDEFAPR